MAGTLKEQERKLTGQQQPVYNTAQAQATQAAQGMQNTWGQQARQQAQSYNGLAGVSGNTAQQLGKYQQGYQQSDAVTQAQQQLADIAAQKPQGYSSKYGEQLDQMLQQIQNPEKFKYSFNGDGLFKYYADVYTQKGKQASQDAMGQAAALTGGYGNSYAQQAGNQAYQQYLLGLYDKGMDLRDRAWEQYQYGQQQQRDNYGLLQNADATDYNRYLDQYNQWANEREYAANRADTEYNRDYGQYADQLNYWTQMAGTENQDYRTAQQMEETKRQWDQQFEYNKMTADRAYAYDICTAILANGKMPSKTQLKAAGISEADAKKMMKQVAKGGGRGGRSKQPEAVNPADPLTQAGQITGAAGGTGLTAEMLKELYMNQGLQDSRNGRRG